MLEDKNLLFRFLLPCSNDIGGIEAWLNKMAKKGYRFVRDKGGGRIYFQIDPTAKNLVYRLKGHTPHERGVALREEYGWQKCNDTIGLNYEVWCKETPNRFELCPDYIDDQIHERRARRAETSWRASGIVMLFWCLREGWQTPRILSHAFVNTVTILLILLEAASLIIKLRNYHNSCDIGWSSIVCSFITSKLLLLFSLFWLICFAL